ncbi:helix-turn-helix domain-containing protein [Micromonospora phytophila]|uniref:helix-turn-helix domain-containing protein n=1 Tax=Micromonospora phytophila TaxID=709888 RepID=UPI003557EA4C
MDARRRRIVPASNVADDHDRLRESELDDYEVEAARHDANAKALLVRALIKLRTDLRISQRKVAQRMGTTQSAVSDLEKGLTDPRLSTLQRYARALRCRLDFEVREGGDGENAAWLAFVHFQSWRNRSIPYGHLAEQVPALGLTEVDDWWLASSEVESWKPPSRVRNPQVQDVHPLNVMEEYLGAVGCD